MLSRLVLVALGALAATSLAPTRAAAHEPGAHVHGVAELHVAIDGRALEIDLESPLDNLLGFEHPPRSDSERAAVRAMAARLRQAQTMFVTPAAAQCKTTKVRLASAALPAELLGETPAAAGAATKDADGHADLDASFSFECQAPERLKGMEVGLMQAFAGFHRINVAVAGPRGQSAAVLTPGRRALSW